MMHGSEADSVVGTRSAFAQGSAGLLSEAWERVAEHAPGVTPWASHSHPCLAAPDEVRPTPLDSKEDQLDDALDDSFPASDPPAPAQPHPDRWFPNGKKKKEQQPGQPGQPGSEDEKAPDKE